MKKEQTAARFSGPFFIVGFPRSGTKLLRSLLNEHPNLGVTNETQMLPYWVGRWKQFGDLSVRSNFHRFYDKALELPYFAHMQEDGIKIIEEESWFNLCKDFYPSGVFEALVRHEVGILSRSDGIWGDKCPSYLIHMPLLNAVYPSARFIHIIRDVRDCALSANRVWGKNIIRAAQRWVERIEQAEVDARPFQDRLLIIRYEDLLDSPANELERICRFLEVNPDVCMTTLSSPSENIGSTKGEKRIVQENKKKYLKELDSSMLHRIEVIAKETLLKHGYPVDYTGEIHAVPKLHMTYYKLKDGFVQLLGGIRYRGLRRGVSLRWKLWTTSGNRQF